MRQLEMGDIVRLNRDCLGNAEGSDGIIYLIKNDIVSVIFEDGDHDDFDIEEQKDYFSRVGHDDIIAKYKYKNNVALECDYISGVFDCIS